MSLTQTIDNDLKTALKSKDELRLSTLRMLKTAIKNKAIELRLPELDDQAVSLVVQKEVKKRQDSMRAFVDGGRPELADKEKAEADILAAYMPQMMSEDQVAKIVDEVLASGEKNFGLIMKAVMAKAEGRTDGQTVQKLVKAKLQP